MVQAGSAVTHRAVRRNLSCVLAIACCSENSCRKLRLLRGRSLSLRSSHHAPQRGSVSWVSCFLPSKPM